MKDTVWIASVPYLFLSPDRKFPGGYTVFAVI